MKAAPKRAATKRTTSASKSSASKAPARKATTTKATTRRAAPVQAAQAALDRVARVAKEVAQQATTAVSEGVGSIKEMGENLVDRVTS